MQIDNGHDDDDEPTVQCAQPVLCANNVISSSLLGEDEACQIPSEEAEQDNFHAGNLDIDLEGETSYNNLCSLLSIISYSVS